MDIEFKLDKGKRSVSVINKFNGEIIGNIFTPSGTGHDREGAIQVCGFDDCFELWGCGIFGDGEGSPKKDIQLLFSENSRIDNSIDKDIISDLKCDKCFHYYRDKDGNRDRDGKCRCDDLRVKSFKEIVVDKLDWKGKTGVGNV